MKHTNWRVQIETAAQRMDEVPLPPHQTLLDHSEFFSAELGCQLYLKQEHMQRTGSFKYRGALNKLLTLTDKDKKRGVIAASTGNHGMATALAARQLGIRADIYVPADASPAKLAQIEGYGARIVQVDGDCLEAEHLARQQSEADNKCYVSPYNDKAVVAGQGTIGLELINQCEDLDAVFVAVGGGGLISGVGHYLKAVKPSLQVVGCWPSHAPAMYQCMQANEVIDVAEQPTLSDGTAGGIEVGAITLPLCQQVIDDTALVSETEIHQAMALLARHEHQMIEGAAAVALAGARKRAHEFAGQNVAVVLCGRNIAWKTFTSVVEGESA